MDAIKITQRPSGVLHLLLNRPNNLNAMSNSMAACMAEALRVAALDDKVKAVVMSGAGRAFCSGSDLSAPDPNEVLPELPYVPDRKNFIEELIDFPKLLIAGCNGSGYGIGCTMLPLFDIVWAVEEASFKTPFSELGASAEGCSSYTFPKILGPALTARMIYLSELIPAKELVPSGFITAILPTPNFESQVLSLADDIVTRLSVVSITTSKSLVRDEKERKFMRDLSKKELSILAVLHKGEDFLNSLKKFQEKSEARRKAKEEAKRKAAGAKL